MTRCLALLAAALLISFPLASEACVRTKGWPEQVTLEPQKVASELVAAATYVNIEVVESVDSDFTLFEESEAALLARQTTDEGRVEVRTQVAAWRAEMAESGVRATYRVVEHLLGPNRDTFTAIGYAADAFNPPPGYSSPPRTISLSDLKWYLDLSDLSELGFPGSCDGPLVPIVGNTYLVFRDADGKLLRASVTTRFRSKISRVQGPAHVPVSGSSDPWVKVVRRAIVPE